MLFSFRIIVQTPLAPQHYVIGEMCQAICNKFDSQCYHIQRQWKMLLYTNLNVCLLTASPYYCISIICTSTNCVHNDINATGIIILKIKKDFLHHVAYFSFIIFILLLIFFPALQNQNSTLIIHADHLQLHNYIY